jgi:hypothetical protein
MTDPASRKRSRWFILGALIVPLGIALAWAFIRASPRSPDDPSELLHRAATSKGTGEPRPTGKVVAVEGTSSSGRPVHVRMPEVRDGSGRVGYAPHLGEPLQPGESATFNMPGGGSITIGRPKDGEAPKLPGAPPKQSAR